jgi:hypothetical protein
MQSEDQGECATLIALPWMEPRHDPLHMCSRATLSYPAAPADRINPEDNQTLRVRCGIRRERDPLRTLDLDETPIAQPGDRSTE